jgi:exodeoxyribonuclease V alpha subunit
VRGVAALSVVDVRGGLERWKRGTASEGVGQAVAYAFDGGCDATRQRGTDAVVRAVSYGTSDDVRVSRFTVTELGVEADRLGATALARWVDGCDPLTGERRGRELTSPDADLLLDGTMNMPKSFSLAVLLTPELRAEFDALQDRIRDRTIRLWQSELNARRGAGGLIREPIVRLEVVELRHERSRALDPHIHRHLWLSVKVLGQDGKWSNVDSRVAMRLHTLVNAEGDLASRTDPAWVAALAEHGYTLDADGEIAELAHLVRPLSRRSNQIEANRALRLARWRQAHPGQQPDHATLAWIDRWAWAQGRPGKPTEVDEDQWEGLVRDEITTLDASATRRKEPAIIRPRPLADIDRDVVAAAAVVEADRRAAGSGGRFSRWDARAGVIRALAASGVVADREAFEEVVEDLTSRVLREQTIDFLEGENDVPSHVKHLMSLPTAQAKLDLGARFDRLNTAGQDVPVDSIERTALQVLGGGTSLDSGQLEAAAAIAGTNRLVTVTGPAGTGKTTLLLVARTALEAQGRRMVVVAPTRKAATVAGRQIGTAASSLHALLIDHGYRFSQDGVGSTVWTRLRPGDADPISGVVYRGPGRFPLRSGDRIVVDEAGMVDLHTANMLAQVAIDGGAGIAMVGDHLQAMPVGHSGAMATMQRRSGSTVELTAIHRFRDPSYGALTLRLREPTDRADAVSVARELGATGHVDVVVTEHEARERMVAAWLHHAARGRRVALVTATNAEAQQINERIQQERLGTGTITADRIAIGQDGQRLLIGDIVQTRRNDTDLGVDNRALWTLTGITNRGVRLTSLTDSGDIRMVDRDYAAEHIHLAYASTVHGIQGETVDRSYVGPGVDAAGLYVGMTRGRHSNKSITIARDLDQGVEQLADTMMRGRLEITLDDARRGALGERGRAARTPPDGLNAVWAVERAARDRLREIDVEITRAEAAGHARADGSAFGGRLLVDERASVQAQIGRNHDEIAALMLERRNRTAGPTPGHAIGEGARRTVSPAPHEPLSAEVSELTAEQNGTLSL